MANFFPLILSLGQDKSLVDGTNLVNEDSDDDPFAEEERLVLNPREEQYRRRRHAAELRRWSSHDDKRRSHHPYSPYGNSDSNSASKHSNDNDQNSGVCSPTSRSSSHPRVQLALKTTTDMALFWIFCVFWAIKEMAVYLITLVCVIVCAGLLNPVLLVLRFVGFRSLMPLQTPDLKPPFQDGSQGSGGSRLWLVATLVAISFLGLYCVSPVPLIQSASSASSSWLSRLSTTMPPSRTAESLDATTLNRLETLETMVYELAEHMKQQDHQTEEQANSINYHLDQLKQQLTQWSTKQSEYVESVLEKHSEKVDRAVASTTLDWTARLEQREAQQEHISPVRTVSPDLINALQPLFVQKSESAPSWSLFLHHHKDDLDRFIQGNMEKRLHKPGAIADTSDQIIEKWMDTTSDDYAMVSRGATVLPQWTSPTFSPFSKWWWSKRYYPSSPKIALTPGMHAGQCWPMKGDHGSLGIRLAKPIVVQAITVDHPNRAVLANQVSSAPKHMEVWGLTRLHDNTDNDDNPSVFLGSFTFDITASTTRQTFDLDGASSLAFLGVIVRIRSNWGNTQHTCLYRISIHGTPL